MAEGCGGGGGGWSVFRCLFMDPSLLFLFFNYMRVYGLSPIAIRGFFVRFNLKFYKPTVKRGFLFIYLFREVIQTDF